MFSSKFKPFALEAAYVWVAELFANRGVGYKCTSKKPDNVCDLHWQLWRNNHWNMTSLTFVNMFKAILLKIW